MAYSGHHLLFYHCGHHQTLVVDLLFLPIYNTNMLTHIVATSLALSAPHTQVGVASWYGKENKTSCTGTRLSHIVPQAAHKTIAIGTIVKVTSLTTGKCTIVTIVDRGPYTKGRILDLNIKAATQIGINEKGIIKVKIEWKKSNKTD